MTPAGRCVRWLAALRTRLAVACRRSQRFRAKRKPYDMRLCSRGWIAVALLAAPITSLAVTCTTQAALQAPDRAALAAVGQRLTNAVLQQDYATLQAQLLPAISSQWDGMRGEVELGAPLVKGG